VSKDVGGQVHEEKNAEELDFGQEDDDAKEF